MQRAAAELERARADLERARAAASGWRDDGRAAFDRQCLEPLTEAGARMLAAIRTADEQLAAAIRLIGQPT